MDPEMNLLTVFLQTPVLEGEFLEQQQNNGSYALKKYTKTTAIRFVIQNKTYIFVIPVWNKTEDKQK